MKFKLVENITDSKFKGFTPLTEMTLNHLVKDHHINGYVILSACVSGYTKDGKPLDSDGHILTNSVPSESVVSEDEIITSESEKKHWDNMNTKKLRDNIISLNYSFLPVYGGYKYDNGEEVLEKSFVIFPFDRSGNKVDIESLISDAKELGKSFNQESILINKPGENPYYWNCASNDVAFTLGKNSDNYTLNDLSKEFFTALKRWNTAKYGSDIKGVPQRYTIECYHVTQPGTVMEISARKRAGEYCALDKIGSDNWYNLEINMTELEKVLNKINKDFGDEMNKVA